MSLKLVGMRVELCFRLMKVWCTRGPLISALARKVYKDFAIAPILPCDGSLSLHLVQPGNRRSDIHLRLHSLQKVPGLVSEAIVSVSLATEFRQSLEVKACFLAVNMLTPITRKPNQ